MCNNNYSAGSVLWLMLVCGSELRFVWRKEGRVSAGSEENTLGGGGAKTRLKSEIFQKDFRLA